MRGDWMPPTLRSRTASRPRSAGFAPVLVSIAALVLVWAGFSASSFAQETSTEPEIAAPATAEDAADAMPAEAGEPDTEAAAREPAPVEAASPEAVPALPDITDLAAPPVSALEPGTPSEWALPPLDDVFGSPQTLDLGLDLDARVPEGAADGVRVVEPEVPPVEPLPETPAEEVAGPAPPAESVTAAPDASEIAAILVTLAATGLAVAVGLWAVRLGRHARHTASQWRSRFAVLEAKLDRAETIFNAQPDLVIIWDEDFDTPAEGWGRPKVLGNPATLATLIKYADHVEGTTPIENVLDGLSKQEVKSGQFVPGSDEGGDVQSGTNLLESIQDLRWHGHAFSLVVMTHDGREIEVEGRPAGAQAVVWLNDITAKARSISGLRSELLALRGESGQLRQLLDSAPFPVWRRGANKRLTWVNQAFADAVDAPSPEDVVAKSIELDSNSRALTDQVSESLKPGNEQRYVVIHGQRRAYDMIEMPHNNGFVGMALDVTGKDQAEKELERHLTAHSETLDKLATGIAIFGPDKKLQYYNQAYASLWALDPAWLDTHPSDSSILDRLFENRLLPEQADFKAWKKQRLDLYKHVTEQPDEIWHLPDSRHLRVACQPHPLGGLLFIYEDVTDRFRLESSLNTLTKVQRAMLDNLSEGVAVFGSDGRVELHNEAFVRIWQLDPGGLSSEPHFTKVVEWCRPLFDDENEWARMAERVTSFSEERHPLAGRLERKDGSFIDYALLPLPNGATLLTCLDVTDTTRITQALRERTEALETADRLKSEFLSHVSYQLRTPLTSIKGFAEMLEQGMIGSLTEKQQEYSHAILNSSDQLTDLIDDILDLARIEAGVMTLELSDTDLKEVLVNSRQFADQQAKNKSITVKVKAGPRLGQIYADERRIRQILFNLISNAISFTGEGGSITIGGERSGDEVRLWVSDTGSGIAPNDQAAVFDRFESRSANGKRRGAGLGLSLVKSFVDLHGGWVSLESAPRVGTKVVCHLPTVAKPAVAKTAREQSAAE